MARTRGEQKLRVPGSPGPPAEGPVGPLPPRQQRSPQAGPALCPHRSGLLSGPGPSDLPRPSLPPQARAYRTQGEPCREAAFCPRRRRSGSAAPTSRPRLLAGGAPARGGGPEGLAAPWPPLIGLCGLRSRAWPMGSGRVEVTGLVFFFFFFFLRGARDQRWSGAGRGEDGRGMKGQDQRMF